MAFRRSGKGREPLDRAGLLDYALKSLGSRMKSERDLRVALARRAALGEEGQQDIDGVIAKLKELGYLSDVRFAADYTRLRQENDKFGQRRVQQGLMQRGIAGATVQAVVGQAYDEVDEVALARAYVARKRMKEPAGERETARTMRRLLAAGFSTRTVWAVLRGWGAELEEVDVVDDAEQ